MIIPKTCTLICTLIAAVAFRRAYRVVRLSLLIVPVAMLAPGTLSSQVVTSKLSRSSSAAAGPAYDAAHDGALAIVRRAMEATGGEERWQALHSLELSGTAVSWHVGDSEWREGPFIPNFSTFHEWRDIAGWRSFIERTSAPQPESPAATGRTVSTRQPSKPSVQCNGSA